MDPVIEKENLGEGDDKISNKIKNIIGEIYDYRLYLKVVTAMSKLLYKKCS